MRLHDRDRDTVELRDLDPAKVGLRGAMAALMAPPPRPARVTMNKAEQAALRRAAEVLDRLHEAMLGEESVLYVDTGLAAGICTALLEDHAESGYLSRE